MANIDAALIDAALCTAERAAEAAETVIRDYWSSGNWTITLKDDDSPVTEADVSVEKVIHQVLQDGMPEAGFLGEETGLVATESQSDMLWLVDPIDGTKSFIRGMPYFSTQIALQLNQDFVVGVSNAPLYGERLVAARDRGARLNGREVLCRSSITSLDKAFLSTGNIKSLADDPAAWSRFGQLVLKVQRVRGYGDFCHYHQLCCGQTDLIIESDVNILDIAALSVAVQSAGGKMTDLRGEPVTRSTSSVLAAASTELHEQALHLLRGL